MGRSSEEMGELHKEDSMPRHVSQIQEYSTFE